MWIEERAKGRGRRLLILSAPWQLRLKSHDTLTINNYRSEILSEGRRHCWMQDSSGALELWRQGEKMQCPLSSKQRLLGVRSAFSRLIEPGQASSLLSKSLSLPTVMFPSLRSSAARKFRPRVRSSSQRITLIPQLTACPRSRCRPFWRTIPRCHWLGSSALGRLSSTPRLVGNTLCTGFRLPIRSGQGE